MTWVWFVLNKKRYTCYVDKETTINGVKYYDVKGLGVTALLRIDEVEEWI